MGMTFGSVLSALTWRGAYAGGTVYNLNDAVTSGGSSYRSLANANTGHTPASSASWWEVIAAKGDTGADGDDSTVPGPAGPAPSGTGLVSVTGGALDTPSTLRARVAADAANLRTDLALGGAAVLAVGTGAGTVAAGDHAHTPGAVGADPAGSAATALAAAIAHTVAGLALSTDPSAAALRTALGLAPTTAAGIAAAQSYLHGGPVALTGWTDSIYVGSVTAPAGGAQPSVVRGSSGVVTVYAPTAGGYANKHILASHDAGGTRGYVLSVDTATLYLISIAGGASAAFTSAVATAGWHTVAWSISAGGATRWSLDGAAVVADGATPTFAARNGDDVRIGRGCYAGNPSSIPIAYLAIWSSVLSDADLVTLATSPSAGYPTLPSAPAWSWAAAQYCGAQQVTIGGTTYAMTGAPQVCVP